jgi:DNA polymerase I-like protein with 3'-5' exonuclease and polymerase domains
MHSRNRDAVGLNERETAKTWFYAFIYGAGDFKLGTIVLSEWDADKLANFYEKFPAGRKRKAAIVRLGKRSRARLEDNIPAFKQLVKKVKDAARRGFILGLDRRKVPIRALHSALNFLCQGAGAIVMKKALVIMFERFKKEGLDVLPLLNVHDEVQLSVPGEQAEAVGAHAAAAITEAGEWFNLRCPLGGDFDVGKTWAETH